MSRLLPSFKGVRVSRIIFGSTVLLIPYIRLISRSAFTTETTGRLASPISTVISVVPRFIIELMTNSDIRKDVMNIAALINISFIWMTKPLFKRSFASLRMTTPEYKGELQHIEYKTADKTSQLSLTKNFP